MPVASTVCSRAHFPDGDPSLPARLWRRMGGPALEQMALGREGRHQGPRQKLLGWQVVASLVMQCLHPCGSLDHIMRRYFAVRVSSPALSQRRVHIPSPPSCATPCGRWRGRNCIQTASLPGCCWWASTARSLICLGTRRGRRPSLCVLVELGTHAPLGAAMDFGPMSKKAMCRQLWESLPPRRQRNCLRKVRRPVNKWPRMFAPTSLSLPKQLEVASIA